MRAVCIPAQAGSPFVILLPLTSSASVTSLCNPYVRTLTYMCIHSAQIEFKTLSLLNECFIFQDPSSSLQGAEFPELSERSRARKGSRWTNEAGKVGWGE